MGNNSYFATVLNELAQNHNFTFFSDEFEVKQILLSTVEETYQAPVTDDYEEAAFSIAIGLYCFIGFCVVLAIMARLHATCLTKADNVRVMGIVYFGIWTWFVWFLCLFFVIFA